MPALPQKADAAPMDPVPSERPRASLPRSACAVITLLALAVFWTYWTTLAQMAQRWSTDAHYSHGFLVPIFALTVLWFRRDGLQAVGWTPSVWGVPLLAGALALRLLATSIDFDALDAFSLLPALAGIALLVGGKDLLLWSWPAIAFLAFMLPLPFSVEMALAHPLRRLATVMSTYLLQTMGYPALSEGNIILIGPLQLGVVDACSGLGMLMTFFALATALVLVIDVPRLDRLILVLSAIPIALIANVLRITVTAMVYYASGDAGLQAAVHDVAGWLMMPLALGLFWMELRFLSRLLITAESPQSQPLALLGAAPQAPGANATTPMEHTTLGPKA